MYPHPLPPPPNVDKIYHVMILKKVVKCSLYEIASYKVSLIG